MNMNVNVVKAYVTLHVSVWVEIYKAIDEGRSLTVTLHVSVWVEIKYILFDEFMTRSRSTWACELKLRVSCQIVGRASSRSTWACELKFNLFKVKSKSSRHAPRERVSWNFGDIHFIVKKFSHAPRERVSWNTLSNDILKTRTMSRSTWACELKFCIAYMTADPRCHAPRERVSWNCSHIVKIYVCFRHAPRERVSWN